MKSKSNNNHGRVVLGLLAAAMNQQSPAQEQTQEMQVLDEVVVSGSRTEEKLSETPMSIGVVDNAVIKRDKPKTMGEVINRIGGVSWNDLGNEQHSMGIRQPNSTNAVYQYLEDGIPIRPLGVFNHNSLNELNLSSADRVEVVKGAASSLYGSNAVGGAVNLITAPSSLTPYASVGYRDENVSGYRRLDTEASNTWGDFGLRFSHYSSRRSAYNWQDYSNGDKDSVTLRSDYALSDSLLHAILTHSDLDSATPGSLGLTDYTTRPGFSYNTFTWRRDKATRFSVGWEGETVPNGQTSVTLFSRNNDHGQLPNYTISACTVGATCPTGYKGTLNNNHVSSLGIDVKQQQDFNWLSSRLIAGLYFDRSHNSYRSDNLDVTRDAVTRKYTSYIMSAVNLSGVRDYETDITNTALFVQWESSPLDKMRLVIGGRNDNIQYDFTNHLTPGANFGAASESRGFSHFSPKIGATYALSQRTSTYANISQGFTPPEVSQLYSKSAVPNLAPATYHNYEVGVRSAFLDGALKLDAALFRLDGKDTIVSYNIAPGNSENRNAGRTRSTGIELNLSWKADEFDARLGASIVNHRYEEYRVSATEDYSGKEMPAAPDALSAEIGYKPINDARIALEMVRQGSYWMNNANTVQYAGHTLLNLRANYRFADGWEAWVQGRNLTDKLYSDSSSSSFKAGQTYNADTMDQYSVGAPRSVMLGLSYTFDAQKLQAL